MAQTKAQKKRAIEGKKKGSAKGYWVSQDVKDNVWGSDKIVEDFMKENKTCQLCGGAGQTFRNRSEMESGEGVICKKCRGNGY